MEFRSEPAQAKYLAWYDEQAARWPVPSEIIMVETTHGSTFVRISGPKQAQPLFLLPGIRRTSLMWEPNITMLAESFRVYTADNIMDYGRSVATNEPQSAEDFVVWLDELFDALGLENGFDLGGFSYGGWIVSRYALARPERPRRLALIAPAATALPLRAMFSVRVIATMLPLRWGTKQFVNWLLGDVLKKQPEHKALVDRSVDELFLASRSYKLQKNIVQPDVLSDAELQRLSETPTLYLVGEMEVIYSAEEALRRIRKVAPAIRLEVLPEAAHLVTETLPAEVDERLLAFLK